MIDPSLVLFGSSARLEIIDTAITKIDRPENSRGFVRFIPFNRTNQEIIKPSSSRCLADVSHDRTKRLSRTEGFPIYEKEDDIGFIFALAAQVSSSNNGATMIVFSFINRHLLRTLSRSDLVLNSGAAFSGNQRDS